MTARKLLWLVLGTVGLPLLIEGSNGCGFHSSASSPIDDNAYTCGCRCDVAPVTKTVTIAANSDDAEQDGTNVRLGGNDLHIGPDIVGLRFVNVGIPKGATIVSANVQFTASATDIDPTTVAIVGIADPSSPTFSNTANDISNRPRTLPSVPWTRDCTRMSAVGSQDLPRAGVVDGEAEQGAGEAAEGAHAVPELEQAARGPVVGSQQGEQMRKDQARNDGAQDRAGDLVLGDAHQARAAFGEPGAGEDAECDEGAEGGDRVAAADRDLAELEVGDHVDHQPARRAGMVRARAGAARTTRSRCRGMSSAICPCQE